MSDQNPISLDSQVIARVRQFLKSTNVTQRELCRMIGEKDAANFNSFLSGSKGLSVNKMHKLLQVLSLNKMQLEAKLGEAPVTAQIVHFQSADGKPLKLDNSGSWVAGDPSGGTDPNDSTDITGTSTARDSDCSHDYLERISAFLKDQQNIHRSAIKAIDDYLAGVQRGKVNVTGTTGPARSVPSNTTSRTPGPRTDLFP